VANGLSRMSSNGDVSSERNRRSMTASHLAAIASAFAIICQVVLASPSVPVMRRAICGVLNPLGMAIPSS
jgi:hypothetical protein